MFFYDLLLTLATPVFIYFPKIASFYDLAIMFTDVSETSLLFIIVVLVFFVLVGTIEILLRGYRKFEARAKLVPKNRNFLSDSALTAYRTISKFARRTV